MTDTATDETVSSTYARTVYIPVRDKADMRSAIRDVMFAPVGVQIEFYRTVEHKPWRIRMVCVYGPGRKKDGAPGARQDERAWGPTDLDSMPEWLTEVVQLAVQRAEQDRTGETPTHCTQCSEPFGAASPLATIAVSWRNGVAETQAVDTVDCLRRTVTQLSDYATEPSISGL